MHSSRILRADTHNNVAENHAALAFLADLNGDGEIDVADAMILFQYVGGSRKTIGNNAETDVTVTYAQAFMNAAESYDVSPYHLVSRVIQEVGSNGSRSVSGTEPGYEGIYNYYNIGAYQSSDPVINALKWASTPSSNEKYLRPWNSRYKAILGGAKYIATGYISVGQNTLYLQKFDVVANGVPVISSPLKYFFRALKP